MADTHSEFDTRLMTHLVEAAGMKSDIENLRTNQNELTSRVLVSLGELAGDLKAIRVDISTVPERISACRVDMRREVERDFPSRLDATEMEKRIENQIRETDRQLSHQISQVDAGSKERHASLKTQIDAVEGKLDKQWVKITTAITVVILILSGLAWIIENISGSVLKEHAREPIRTGSWESHQRGGQYTLDTSRRRDSVGSYRRRT